MTIFYFISYLKIHNFIHFCATFYTVRNFCIKLPLHVMEVFQVLYIKFNSTLCTCPSGPS